MRKVSLLLALAFAGLSGFAQYNAIDIKKNDAESNYSTATVNKSASKSNEVKAPGDVIWIEDFSDTEAWSQDPSEWTNGWTVTDDAGFAGWQYIAEDTVYTGAYTDQDAVINTEGVGYMHLPADFYNCTPGSWPPTMVPSPVDMDATIETGWIDISDVEGGIVLSYATWFRYCCNSSTTKLDVSVTTDGNNWTTFDGKDLDGLVGVNASPEENPSIDEIKISSITAGADQVKIQFRMHGGSHYFWSIDDITLKEAETNDLNVSDVFHSFDVYSNNESSFTQRNNNYSEMPVNFLYYPQLGALVNQKGNNAMNAAVNFSLDSAGVAVHGTSSWNSMEIIPEFGNTYDVDTVFLTDTTNNYENVHFFYHPEMTWADFDTDELQNDGIPYNFYYEATSDNEDVDMSNNYDTIAFNQTWGRLSYHWQGSFDASFNGTVGNNYQGITPVPGDSYGNTFQMFQNDGESFKIYGIRFFLPNSTRVSFDGSGNGVTLHPVIYFYDATANSGDGAYVKLEDVNSAPYTLSEADDLGEFVYLPFEAGDVEDYDFQSGNYIIGVEVDDYNGQEFVIGTDGTFRQGHNHFLMKIDGEADFGWYGRADGAVMIDVYTQMNQMLLDQTGVKEVNKNTLDKVNVYPNPTSGIVNIKNVENSTISVYTIAGNLVQTIENAEVNATINLAGLAKGYYLVKIVTENEVVTKKVNLK